MQKGFTEFLQDAHVRGGSLCCGVFCRPFSVADVEPAAMQAPVIPRCHSHFRHTHEFCSQLFRAMVCFPSMISLLWKCELQSLAALAAKRINFDLNGVKPWQNNIFRRCFGFHVCSYKNQQMEIQGKL